MPDIIDHSAINSPAWPAADVRPSYALTSCFAAPWREWQTEGVEARRYRTVSHVLRAGMHFWLTGFATRSRTAGPPAKNRDHESPHERGFLETKLSDFQHYYNGHRTHAGLDG